MRFVAGMLIGLLLGGGGGYLVFGRGAGQPVAQAASADAGVAADPGAKNAKKKKGKPGGRRPGGGVAGGEGDYSDEPIPELSAGDLAPGAEGDSLKPRPRDVDLSAEGGEVRDLSQAEIDGTFGQAAAGITDCITQTRGPAPVTGRISVGLIVGPDGKVARSRVEAPAYLLRKGLYRCVRREVGSLRFPAVGRDTVVTVPFDLT